MEEGTGTAMSVPKALSVAAVAKGLRVADLGCGHFQIIGGTVLVNYWPNSKRRTAYVDGERGGKSGVSPQQAVEMALRGKPVKSQPTKAVVLCPVVRDSRGSRSNTAEGWPELGLAKFYFGRKERSPIKQLSSQ